MEIRFAENKDVLQILKLLRQVGKVHHDGRPDLFRAGAQKYGASQIIAMLDSPTMPIFVAVEGERLLGYCFCMIKEYSQDPVFTDYTSLYIDDLCVDESRRGQGIATKLYDHVTAFAKSIGCDYITLNVWCGNDGALKFYEKAGMTKRNIHMEMKLC